MALRAQRLDCTGGRNVRAFDRGEQRITILHARPPATRFERRVIGLRRSKRVGFVLKTADCDARHQSDPLRENARA